MMPGSTSRAALTGTLRRNNPAGLSRKTFTTSMAASTSVNAGPSRCSRCAPASVGTTLRVVRLSSLTPSCASRRRTASLRLDALLPLTRAPSRKPLARATATKAWRSPRSTFTVRFSAQPVRIVPDYREPTRRLSLSSLEGRSIMASIEQSGTFKLGDDTVKRLGYGAMQLAGPGVFGPPRDHAAALAVLREAVASGIDHIDTSDFYGPHVTNQIIREALHPYPDDLVIVTKIGARRGADGSWIPAFSPEELTQAVHDNLRNLGLDVLDVVNLRVMINPHHPAEGSIEADLSVLADLQRQGLVRHIGLSHVTPTQVAEGRRICKIVCVQNLYNVAHREDDALIDDLARDGIAYVPYFPLGGFNPLQSSSLDAVAARLGATPMQVALA